MQAFFPAGNDHALLVGFTESPVATRREGARWKPVEMALLVYRIPRRRALSLLMPGPGEIDSRSEEETL